MAVKRNTLIVGAAVVIIIAVVAVISITLNTGVETPTSTRKPSLPDIVEYSSDGVPRFTDYAAGPERKAAFFGYLLPMVQERNEQILQTREEIKSWRQKADNLSSSQISRLEKLAKEHRMDGFDPARNEEWTALLARVDVVPPSLALAQAANESAWGTSRFARKAYNYYGQWCFEKGCGVVPKARDTGKSHEVARFDSPKESVRAYIQNLNSHPAYQALRDIRTELRQKGQPITGIDLAGGLERYSERGHEYIKELRSMIRFNKLDQLDNV